MTIVATRVGGTPTELSPARRLGLSSRLILLTLLVMMIAEILVYLPAAASFRRSWLSDRLMAAQMVALTLSAAPRESMPPDLEGRLLGAIKGAQAIGVRGPGTRWLLTTQGDVEPAIEREIDLRQVPWYGPIRGLVHTLWSQTTGNTRVIGDGSPGIPAVEWVELIVSEQPLRDAVLAFTRNFLLVSLAISGATAALMYLALHFLVVRPVQRLSTNIAAFAAHPEEGDRVIVPSGRTDEIGIAEKALSQMQVILATELKQKRRLADLGLAVSKINHELRNMLTTAQLLGDRLSSLSDPAVKRIAPRLIRTLDRAIEFCGATLAYGRAGEAAPKRRRVPLLPIVMDQLDLTKLADGYSIRVEVDVPEHVEIDVDPEQLGRILLNLMRNSVQALAQAKTQDACISVSGERRNGHVTVTVRDNGPGVPERIRTRIFSAFQASERSGGTGLGLPVAEELARLHGGSLALCPSSVGACFEITIPDRAAS